MTALSRAHDIPETKVAISSEPSRPSTTIKQPFPSQALNKHRSVAGNLLRVFSEIVCDLRDLDSSPNLISLRLSLC